MSKQRTVLAFFIFLMTISLSWDLWALTASVPATDPRWESVVLIKTDAIDTDGGDVPSFCNGTFLSPHLIVTAAHCLVGAQTLKSFRVEIQVGAYKFLTRRDGSVVRIGYVTKKQAVAAARFHFTPKITEALKTRGHSTRLGPGDDIAIIRLDHDFDLPSDFSFAQIVTSQEMRQIRNQLVNFHPTVVTINFMEEISSNDTKRSAKLTNLKYNSNHNYLTSKSSSRVQEGDSGSPVFTFINGNWKLIAVVKGRAKTLIFNWDVFPTTYGNLCQISYWMPADDQKLLCR